MRRDQRTDEKIGIEDETHRSARRLAALRKTFGADLGQGFLDGIFDFCRRNMRVSGTRLLDGLLNTSCRAASAMNFERSPFLSPF